MSERTKDDYSLTMPSDREITMTRVFDAPRELVFQAHTDPQHVQHWWGQRGSTTIVDTMDVRPGGAWRFVQRDPEGNEYGFRGEYREVVPPERLVYTFEFEGMPGHILVETITFEEHDGKTRLTSTSLFTSVEDRDGMLESGMESGAIESWDRLAELLETLR
ncbi:MAG TPA: SRPBCC family protein [Thermomicrobiales bacterium]|nr:SRPBCC family protein [Thermomicrobiales bacterium]